MSIFQGSRYSSANVRLLDGKLTIDVRSREPVSEFSFRRYQPVEADRIDLLAHKYLRSEAAWWFIADANDSLYPEPTPGNELRIPEA